MWILNSNQAIGLNLVSIPFFSRNPPPETFFSREPHLTASPFSQDSDLFSPSSYQIKLRAIRLISLSAYPTPVRSGILRTLEAGCPLSFPGQSPFCCVNDRPSKCRFFFPDTSSSPLRTFPPALRSQQWLFWLSSLSPPPGQAPLPQFHPQNGFKPPQLVIPSPWLSQSPVRPLNVPKMVEISCFRPISLPGGPSLSLRVPVPFLGRLGWPRSCTLGGGPRTLNGDV